jgi:hypothetical protein
VARARARPAALPRSAGSRARARAEGRGPRARPSPHLSRTAPAAAALPAFLLGSWEWPLTWRAPCGGLRGTTPHRTGAAAHVRACAGPRLPLDGITVPNIFSLSSSSLSKPPVEPFAYVPACKMPCASVYVRRCAGVAREAPIRHGRQDVPGAVAPTASRTEVMTGTPEYCSYTYGTTTSTYCMFPLRFSLSSMNRDCTRAA